MLIAWSGPAPAPQDQQLPERPATNCRGRGASGPPEQTERTLGGERRDRVSADKTTRAHPAQAVTEPERAATRDYEALAPQTAQPPRRDKSAGSKVPRIL